MSEAGRLGDIQGLWKQGQRQEALGALDAYLADHADDGSAWSLRGLYLLDLDAPDREEALRALKRSIEIEPTYPAAYNAGNALLDLGRAQEALAMFDVSIGCFDRYPEAWVNRGIALSRLRRGRDGIASFDRALALDANFLPALRCKAIGLENLGDKSESESVYARMVELNPDNVRILSEYGQALSRLPPDNHMELEPHGREWKAVETLNLVIERNAQDVRAWLAKAEVLYRCMHANLCFRRSVLDYVRGPLKSGSFQDDLVMLLQAAQQRFPDRAEFPRYMGEVYAFQGDPEGELPYRQKVRELAPQDADACVRVFELGLELEQRSIAVEALARAIALDPSYRELLDGDCPPEVADEVRRSLA